MKRAVRYAIERKSAENELASLGRQNEMILDSAGEGICGLDAAGIVTFANPAAAGLLGCPREEFLGSRFHDVVHPKGSLSDGHDDAECPIQIALLGGRELPVGLGGIRARRREQFPVEYSITPYAGGTAPGRGGDLQGHHRAEAVRAATPVSRRP